MILVMLGTQNNGFHRLLEEVQKNIDNGNITEDVVVQKGYTKFESKDMTIYDQLPQEDILKLIDDSSFVITHGGVGSIITAITKGKKVIAVPRLKAYKEHVNDHQLDIIKSFGDMGYIIGLNGVEELPQALKQIDNFEPKKYVQNTGKILKIIEDFIN